MNTERTLLMIKPDGVRRGLVGAIIDRIERKGLPITNMRMFTMDAAFARVFYAEHVERDFFPTLLDFMTSGPVVALEIEATHAVSVIRTTIGATRPEDRLPGTIRGDYSILLTENVVHASASTTDAQRELALVFGASSLSPAASSPETATEHAVPGGTKES
ncbi:MAG: nucleoside-diphosphate kinase [Candidatus Cryosericum sp.]